MHGQVNKAVEPGITGGRIPVLGQGGKNTGRRSFGRQRLSTSTTGNKYLWYMEKKTRLSGLWGRRGGG